MQEIINSTWRAIDSFKLIKDGDSICVAISGGKDSLALMEALLVIKKIFKRERNVEFKLVPIHIQMSLCLADYDELNAWFKTKEIELIIVNSHIAEILKSNTNKGKIQCSLCSTLKKGMLIEEMLKHGCNKLAMGHHADDAIETLFMNMCFNGKIATFQPSMYMSRKNVHLIRPLALTREIDIIKAAKKANLPMMNCGCPMEGYTQREVMKDLLNDTFYKNNNFKDSFNNFLTALYNDEKVSLWKFLNKK